MSISNRTRSSRATTTFNPAMWILGMVAAAQVVAVGWSFASRVQLAPLGGARAGDGPGVSAPSSVASPPSPSPAGGAETVPPGTVGLDGTGATHGAATGTSLSGGSFAGGVGSPTFPAHSVDPTPSAPATVSPAGETTPALSSADPTAILNTTAATHVHNGNTLRARGDTQGALEQYRLALVLLPDHPRVLYELASTYESMGLTEKAAESWEKIYRLGQGAGELFVLADLKLRGNDGTASLSEERPIAIGTVQTSHDGAAADGSQRVVLQISLKTKPGFPIDTSLFEAHVHFFDQVDGVRVDQTTADPPVSRWISGPEIDWADFGEEVLEVVYFHPAMTPDELVQFGSREYYGYIVKLYYDNQLVDQAAEPRMLLEYLFQGGGVEPALDNSLFLNE